MAIPASFPWLFPTRNHAGPGYPLQSFYKALPILSRRKIFIKRISTAIPIAGFLTKTTPLSHIHDPFKINVFENQRDT